MNDIRNALNWSDETETAMSIFQPYAKEKILGAVSTGRKFVHYTSAETASLILQTKTILLRQASLMNDFREIEFGTSCIQSSWVQHKLLFDEVFSTFEPTFGQRLWDWFSSWKDRVRWETFITCVSEHDTAENKFGRLSMWRAYGGTNGVALVVNGTPLVATSDALGAYSSPVAYHTTDSFSADFESLILRVRDNFDFLRSKSADWVFGQMCHTLHYAMLCTKHYGFCEEREWRVVRSPAFNTPSNLIESIKTISGIPQKVLTLELKDNLAGGLVGIEIPSLLDRVIIGPTQQPVAIGDALKALLKDAGVRDPMAMIAFSEIPLRR
jgi:hypothetical protein